MVVSTFRPPLARARTAVDMAPMPELKAKASSAPSSEATALSRGLRVGLTSLEYLTTRPLSSLTAS
ncbi:MAG: hypothetical protein RXR09_03875 [Acidilobus sp.]